MKSSGGRANSNTRTVIGLHASREALKVRPDKITEIWVKNGAERSADLLPFIDFAKKRRIKLLTKPDGFLDKIASSHQGICVLVSETPQFDVDDIGSDHTEKIILLALDEITDPHNVGAVLRTAWLLGAKAVLVPENRSAHLTPAAIKVASGGAEHVPLVNVGNLSHYLTSLKDKGFWVYGLAAEAKSSLWQTKFNERVVLIVGSEDKGMRSTTANVCDELVSIPQQDSHASFNASVAASLVLYEVARQHKNP
ncbi:MAG: 23S rRNA (guanosine(2251)-2'-O)-methyltransferase RlmB [Bdellovibrionales bacterium]|nr:23S rRNA (guanosine(2251)-2'-O)-methyltransferase RlmB [Bdellovibrionales bacterium]